MAVDDSPKLPVPPFIILPGIDNLRDVGGYPVAPKGSVRRRFLYRSAHLAKLTDETAEALAKELGIKWVYDFRSHSEAERIKSHEIPGATRLHLPVFPDADAAPENIALRFRNYSSTEPSAGFVRAYTEILDGGALNAYRVVFEHIRDKPDEPLLFHCMGGKDRTGVFAALCLRLAGVPDDEIIIREYALTTIGMHNLKKIFLAHMKELPMFSQNPQGAEKMLSSEPAYMREFLKHFDERYGSVEQYLRDAVKFGDEDIEKIKNNLRSDEDPINFEY